MMTVQSQAVFHAGRYLFDVSIIQLKQRRKIKCFVFCTLREGFGWAAGGA
jgi:hypothetical protein